MAATATANGGARTSTSRRSQVAIRPLCHARAPGQAHCLALIPEHVSAAQGRGTAAATGIRAAVGVRPPSRPAAGLPARARPVPLLAIPPAARTEGAAAGECGGFICLGPADLRAAYFPNEAPKAPAGSPQTIALVDAFNDYAIEEDLHGYDEEFGLPPFAKCKTTTETACLEVVNQKGTTSELPFPQQASELEEAQEACTAAEQSSWIDPYNAEVKLIKEVETGRKEKPSGKALEELEEREAELEALEEAFEKEEPPPAPFLRKRLGQSEELACEESTEAAGWSGEISLDVESAHAVCQDCKILLVETGRPTYATLREFEDDSPASYENLNEGETTATENAEEISNSWGGGEPFPESPSRATAEREVEEAVRPFNKPGKVITASAGDEGYLEWGSYEEAEAEYISCEEFARLLASEERAEEEEWCEEAIYFFQGADFPATSPTVIAVGGTKLTMSGGAYGSESVWNDDPVREGEAAGENYGAGGGGCSELFGAPTWQSGLPDWSEVGCEEFRATNDIAADADPLTGLAVYDSIPEPVLQESEEPEGCTGKEIAGESICELQYASEPLGWWPIGGTSASSPVIAAMFALAGGSHGVPYPAQTLYEHLDTAALHEITAGGNGECDNSYAEGCSGSMARGRQRPPGGLLPVYCAYGTSSCLPFDCGEGTLICNAAPGCASEYYAGPAGVGTPNGIAAFTPAVETTPLPARECPGGKSEEQPKVQPPEAPKELPKEAPKEPPPPQPKVKHHKHRRHHTAPRISHLRLTRSAAAAIRHGRPKLSSLKISFKISAAAKVRVTLLERVRVHHHTLWAKLGHQTRLHVSRGRHRIRLHGRARLSKGRYRIRLVPARGHAVTLRFRVR